VFRRWSQSDLDALCAFCDRREQLAADSVVFLVRVVASVRFLILEVADKQDVAIAGAQRDISMQDQTRHPHDPKVSQSLDQRLDLIRLSIGPQFEYRKVPDHAVLTFDGDATVQGYQRLGNGDGPRLCHPTFNTRA
jgi:hypothetical protein